MDSAELLVIVLVLVVLLFLLQFWVHGQRISHALLQDSVRDEHTCLLWTVEALADVPARKVLDGLEREFESLPRLRPWTWSGLVRFRTDDAFSVLFIRRFFQDWRLIVLAFPDDGGPGARVSAGMAQGTSVAGELPARERLVALQGQVEAYLDRIGRRRGQQCHHP